MSSSVSPSDPISRFDSTPEAVPGFSPDTSVAPPLPVFTSISKSAVTDSGNKQEDSVQAWNSTSILPDRTSPVGKAGSSQGRKCTGIRTSVRYDCIISPVAGSLASMPAGRTGFSQDSPSGRVISTAIECLYRWRSSRIARVISITGLCPGPTSIFPGVRVITTDGASWADAPMVLAIVTSKTSKNFFLMIRFLRVENSGLFREP